MTTAVCWLQADNLEMVYYTQVPVTVKGSFVKSVACKNFQLNSEEADLFKCHTMYAVSATDTRIHVYQQVGMTIQYLDHFDVGGVSHQKIWYLTLHDHWFASGKDN